MMSMNSLDRLTAFDVIDSTTAEVAVGNKRDRSEAAAPVDPLEDIFESTAKKISLAQEDAGIFVGPAIPPLSDLLPPKQEIQPYPFYYYQDYSTDGDPDPLTPLTPPGRVPNFPAKMHSILCRDDLSSIISWMPHGRSWRVLKPREFEVRVIPTYFEHAKFSSFIRQANGWGFRRITQGRDRNSYYHPLFLRGLPHLCKRMKRPGVAEKLAADPDHEPDLAKISELHPVPKKAADDAILLRCTLQGGPKARVPIYSGQTATSAHANALATATPKLTPSDQQALAAFQQSLGASESQLTKKGSTSRTPPMAASAMPAIDMPQSNILTPVPFSMPFNVGCMDKTTPLLLANQLAFASNQNPPSTEGNKTEATAANGGGDMQAALHATSAASQFAAGFAAATALSHQQFQAMLAQMQKQGLVVPEMKMPPMPTMPAPVSPDAKPAAVVQQQQAAAPVPHAAAGAPVPQAAPLTTPEESN